MFNFIKSMKIIKFVIFYRQHNYLERIFFRLCFFSYVPEVKCKFKPNFRLINQDVTLSKIEISKLKKVVSNYLL